MPRGQEDMDARTLLLVAAAWIAWLLTVAITSDLPEHDPHLDIRVWATPVTETTP